MRGVGALTFDSGMEDGQEHGGSGSGLRRGARTGSGVIISGLCSGGKQHDRKQCQAGSDGGGGAAMIRRIMVLRTGCRQVRKSGRADLAARTLQLAFYTSHLGLSMLGIFADLCRTCL